MDQAADEPATKDVQESPVDTEQSEQESSVESSEQESTVEVDSVEEEQEVEESDSDGEEEITSSDDSAVKKLVQKNRKINRENQKLRERALNAEHELEKLKAVIAVGLPADMAKRLHGNNAEELRQDAEELVSIVGKRRRIPGALPDDGVHHKKIVNDDEETDLNKIGARIYER